MKVGEEEKRREGEKVRKEGRAVGAKEKRRALGRSRSRSRYVLDHERLVKLFGCVIDDEYGKASGSGLHAALLIMERMAKDLHQALRAGLDWASRYPILPPHPLARKLVGRR